MPQCPYCDISLTRTAVMIQRLERTSQLVHQVLGHTPSSWRACEEEPCRANRVAIETGALPNYADYLRSA